MIKKPGLNTQPGSFEEWVYENAQGKVIILDSQPTAAVPLLTEGQFGFDAGSSGLFTVIGGVLYGTVMIPIP